MNLTFNFHLSLIPCLPPEVEIVDQSYHGRNHRFLTRLRDLFHDGVEVAVAFDGIPIGISDGLPEGRRFWLARFRGWGGPGLENVLGAVENLLVPPQRRPVRPSHTLGGLRFAVDERDSLSIAPLCQVFPEGRNPVWLPSRQSVFRMSFIAGSGGGFPLPIIRSFSVPVENKPVPARAYGG